MFLALMWDVREGRGARMEKMVSLMSKINHYSALTNGKHKRGFCMQNVWEGGIYACMGGPG